MTSNSALDWGQLDPPLRPATRAAIAGAFAFERMTPVQAATIPLFAGNRDVAVQACTGSGKTLAFLVPIVEVLQKRADWRPNEVGALIISPTRELAQQIVGVAQRLLDHLDGSALKALLLVGGASAEADAAAMQHGGANIVVATPGRLEETLCSPTGKLHLDVRALDVLVLDEADRLLDMGFEASINRILKGLPKQRRTGLFSATQTREVEGLVRAGLRNPSRVDVQVRRKDATQATPLSLTNRFQTVAAERKLAELVRLLAEAPGAKVIVFVLTCAMVDYLGAVLPLVGALRRRRIRALHGKMKQAARTGVYGAFVAEPGGVLLCTDLVARGVDIPDVDLIVQYDAPQDPSFFVHRVGRTARMGRQGNAIVFLLPSEGEYVDVLRVQSVPLGERALATPADGAALTRELRALALADRDVMQLGQRAFVSFVRGYKEHYCNYVFQLAQLPLVPLAMGLGLLFLPRMPETANLADVAAFESAGVSADDVKFKDKQREKQRLVNLEAKQAARHEAKLARDNERKQAASREKVAVKARRKRKQSELQDRQAEWDELAAEMYEFRRYKRGQITKREFEVLVGERAPDAADDAKSRRTRPVLLDVE